MAEFPRRNWSLAAVKRLLQKIDVTGSADRKTGSGNGKCYLKIQGGFIWNYVDYYINFSLFVTDVVLCE